MFFKRSLKKKTSESSLVVELSPPSVGPPCDCCGGVTTTLTRFVYRDGAAHAVYYAAFSDNHPDRFASALVSVGRWGEGSTPDQRVSFCLRLWTSADQHNVQVVDPSEVGWSEAHITGPKLARSEALAHPSLQDVFAITDLIFADDLPLARYLQENQRPSTVND